MSTRARAAAAAACLIVPVIALHALPHGAGLPPHRAPIALASSPGVQPVRLHAPRDGAAGAAAASAGSAIADVAAASLTGALDPELLRDEAARAALRTDHERRALAEGPSGHVPVTAAVLVVPVEFAGAEDIAFQQQNAARQCITVTRRFTGPLHGGIPYPGGGPTATLDNNTVFYPSTEPDDYRRLIFGREGFTRPLRAGDPNVNGGLGADVSGLTVQSYFDAQSDGTVTLTGDVAPWVAVEHAEAWYGIDVCLPNASPRAIPDQQLGALAELATRAVDAVRARGGVYDTYDFWKRLDGDGDGMVDTVWIVHAGRGQEYGGGSEGAAAIWSRAGDVRSLDGVPPTGHVVHDGGTPDASDDIRVGSYTMLPEDSDLGVLVEEFGHAYFGLPDLYTAGADNSVGWWAPMSDGIWGGELGGTRPVNMPLWFRLVADCGGRPCGWADPVKTLDADDVDDEGELVVLGRAGVPAGGTVSSGPYSGRTIYEGLRVDLPDRPEDVPNRAGTGGGAYSGESAGGDLVLQTTVDLSRATAPPTLSVDGYWRLRQYFAYAHVEAAGADGRWMSLPDMDGKLTTSNPYGTNEGYGLTGNGNGTLRFDLSPLAGVTATVRLRVVSYLETMRSGFWVDNVRLPGALVESFDDGLAGWTTEGWTAVPHVRRDAQHYLVEWRSADGFDASLLGATATSYADADEWRVDRVPANVPGAVVWLRSARYPLGASLSATQNDPPSIGPKGGLLVVDPNVHPATRPSGRALPGDLESLDAALALGRQPDYTLELRDATTGALQGTDRVAGRPGARRFDDAYGTAAGFRQDPSQPAATPAPWSAGAGVVVPSRDGRVYPTRLTLPDGTRPHPMDGQTAAEGHVWGGGNPGEADAQMGVHVEVVDQASDGSWGVVRVHTRADLSLTADVSVVAPGERVAYTLRMRASDAPRSLAYTLLLPPGLVLAEGQASGELSAAAGAEATATVVAEATTAMAAGADLVAEAVFVLGTDRQVRRVTVRSSPGAYLPIAWTGR